MDRVRFFSRLHPGRVVLALVLCLWMTGCGPSQGEVAGTVRYNGKPLPSGTIQFLGQDGVPYSGKIQPDGSFSVQVPVGEAKVIVSCVDEERLTRFTTQMASNRGRVTAPPPADKKFSLIPQRYADWNTSGLTVVVESGKTVQDFALTSR